MPRRRAQLIAVLSAAVVLLSPPAAMAQQPETRQATLPNLIAGLNNISAQIQTLHNLSAQSIRVMTVDVGDLLNSNNAQVLNSTIDRNQMNIGALQSFLNNSQTEAVVTIRNVLTRNQILVSEVTAIDVLSHGDVIVFYQLADPGRLLKTP